MDKNIYKWDIESLLNNETIEVLFDKFCLKQDEIIKLYKTFLDSEENFINFLFEVETFTCISNRLYNYLSNNYNEDLSNPKWIAWFQKLTVKNTEYNKIFSDYENIIIANEEKIRKYLKNPKISEYSREFENIFRYKEHLLSKDCEYVLAQLSSNSQAIDDIYSTLTDNDFKYEDAIDNKGNKIPLSTQADIFKNLRSKDEVLRKSTWLNFYKTFYQYRNTLTKTLYYNYLQLNTHAKVRKFSDYISQTAFNDEITKEFIENLYLNIKKFKPLYEKFQNLRKKYLSNLLNKNQLDPWDFYLELSNSSKKYSLEEVKEIAYDSLSILGPDYQALVKKAFDERWISFLPSPNKQTGAYSIGNTKGLDKYFISMNYDETIQSIFTLVHELGHSINSYFFGKAQKIYQDTKIFYAEIASITNETILSHYLLSKSENDLDFRLMILDQIISGFFNTTTRQIIFSNFEWMANHWVNNGEEFTYEKISKTYYNLIDEYAGVEKKWEEYCKEPYLYSLVTPLRISHFYAGNFYVYKYAVGQIAALIITDEIVKNKPNAKEKLFNFLSSGTSRNPLDTIKLLGIDLTKNDAFETASKILSEWIEQFEQIINKLLKKN